MNVDFVIRNPLWERIAVWVITAIGVVTVAVTTVLRFTVSMDDAVFAGCEAGGAAGAGLGLLFGYIVIVEKFEFKDGVFSYRKPFKKNQAASTKDIERVEVRDVGAFILPLANVSFYGRDEKKLISFLDDGTAFQSGKFIKALQEKNIPISFT